VILIILVKESLDLELRLKRYGILKFQAIFVDFSEAKDLSGITFQISGPNRKIRDCGLIFEKPRGFFVKLPGIIDFRIIFLKKTRGPSPRVRGPRQPGPPWTVRGRVARAHWSLASGRSDAQGRQPRGRGRGDGVGEPVEGLTGGQPIEGTAAAVGVPVRGSLELRERRRREQGGAVLSRGAPSGFYRVGEGAHTQGMGGDIDGGVHRLSEEGEAEVANKGGVREEGVASQLLSMAREMGGGPVRHGRGAEDGGARPACSREEDEGGAGWQGRPKAESQRQFGGGCQKGRKGEWASRGGRRGGPRLGRIRSQARIQKNFFSNFNLFLEFGRTLEICTRRFRRDFDTRSFSKIF
jgi:hypothetical protein